MAALFTSPRFIALSSSNQLLPGAKLSFYQTGTSTPQNTYQDAALTTPHANPVVADGAGVFGKIYLDPSLPNYRVTLTDSANVIQPGYPIDDYPSNQNTGQTFRLKSVAPELVFEETDASANNKKIRVRVNAELLTISTLNDAESVATDVVTIDRSGSVSFPLGTLSAGAENIYRGNAAYKTASTARSSTTTLANDPHLLVALQSSSVYIIEGQVSFQASTSGAGGAKFALEYSGTTFGTIDVGIDAVVNGTGAVSVAPVSTTIPLTYATVSTTLGADVLMFRKYIRTTTAGNFSLQWAQNSSNANALQLNEGSWLRAHKIA